MKKLIIAVAIATVCGIVSACATMSGAAIGAGIGSLSGNTGSGLLIGAGVGGLIDAMD